MQVSAHKDAVSLFERCTKGGEDPKLKDWAGKTLPTLQHHLEMAQDMKEPEVRKLFVAFGRPPKGAAFFDQPDNNCKRLRQISFARMAARKLPRITALETSASVSGPKASSFSLTVNSVSRSGSASPSAIIPSRMAMASVVSIVMRVVSMPEIKRLKIIVALTRI
jgi:hypothetical protein